MTEPQFKLINEYIEYLKNDIENIKSEVSWLYNNNKNDNSVENWFYNFHKCEIYKSIELGRDKITRIKKYIKNEV